MQKKVSFENVRIATQIAKQILFMLWSSSLSTKRIQHTSTEELWNECFGASPISGNSHTTNDEVETFNIKMLRGKFIGVKISIFSDGALEISTTTDTQPWRKHFPCVEKIFYSALDKLAA